MSCIHPACSSLCSEIKAVLYCLERNTYYGTSATRNESKLRSKLSLFQDVHDYRCCYTSLAWASLSRCQYNSICRWEGGGGDTIRGSLRRGSSGGFDFLLASALYDHRRSTYCCYYAIEGNIVFQFELGAKESYAS